MPSLWRFGGLTPLKLIRLSVSKIRKDELSTRSAALSYYFLIALFPMFLFASSLMGLFAGPGSPMIVKITSSLGRLAPGSATSLIHDVVSQTLQNHDNGIKMAAGLVGALWAASGGMSAIVTSLNVVNGTEENRPWWKKEITVLGLTICVAILTMCALALALYGGSIGRMIAGDIGVKTAFSVGWSILEWALVLIAVFLSYSLIYYFAPALDVRKWYWATPGAVTGLSLWILASLGFRFYLHFFNHYSMTYGSLGAVVILMLWLYITGFAILVGGEVNWVIENEDRKNAGLDAQQREFARKLNAA